MSLIKNSQKLTYTLFLLVIATLPLNLAAKQGERKRFQLTHNKAVIKVDGRMDEAVWQTATKMELKYE